MEARRMEDRECLSPEGCRGCWVLGGKPAQVGHIIEGILGRQRVEEILVIMDYKIQRA